MCIPERAARARGILQAPPYHGSARANRAAGIRVVVLTAVLAFGSGACSMSFPLDSEFFSSKSEKAADADKGGTREVTGSIARRDANGSMQPADWSLATAALREALGETKEGASIPWQNPSTGARGTVTPVASSYVQDGFACRDFLASHVGDGQENWFEGTACRVHRGEWDIRSTRPIRKS